MKRKITVRAITFLLALLICIYSVPVCANAYSYESVRSLLNSQILYPQKTGYETLDKRVAELVSSWRTSSSDTYELVLAAYDWLVYNVKYDSSLSYYPYYDFNSRYECPVPYYAVTFAYEPLFKKEGVCDNFASAFVVIARVIGLDAYIRTGHMVLRSGAVNAHTWCEIKMNGSWYIFDPQADNSVYSSTGKNKHYYFGPKASSMTGTYRTDAAKTAKFEAAHVPVNENPAESYCYVHRYIGGDGNVTTNAISQNKAINDAKSALWNTKDYSQQFSGFLEGYNLASKGTTVTLTAVPDQGASFLGWYVDNTLVSHSLSYTFYPTKDTYVEAVFSGERFRDVKYGSWYYDQVYYCCDNKLMSGVSMTTFAPGEKLTRAMVVCILGKMINLDTSAYKDNVFSDVRVGSWYASYVDWAHKSGITTGYSANSFGPGDPVTREQLVVFFYKFATYLKYNTAYSKEISSFPDSYEAHEWALPGLKYAYALGLITGRANGELDPRGAATRAEMAAIVKRFRTGT